MRVMGHSELVAATRPGGPASAPTRQDLAPALAEAFLAGYSGATAAAYRGDLRHWATWCEDHGVGLLDAHRAHVDLYLREQEAVHSHSTLARRLSAMSGFYGYALDEALIDRSPVARVRRPRVSEESATLGLDKAELHALLAAAKASGARDHALTCLLALNGLRVSEVCALDVSDLSQLRGHTVLSARRKGGKLATVPLASETALAVADRKILLKWVEAFRARAGVRGGAPLGA